MTLFYDTKNSRDIHIEEGKEFDVFGKFIITHTNYNSSIVFDHKEVIKMLNDTHARLRRKEAINNEVFKHTRYDWLKNSDNL